MKNHELQRRRFHPRHDPMGGCKVIPGDTEISPTGYCTAWAKKA